MSENNTELKDRVMESRFKQTKITSSFLFVMLLVIGDQVAKGSVVRNMALGEKKPVIDGFFYFHYVQNTGSAFSFLADTSWGIYVLSAISLIFSIIILCGMVFAILHNFNKIGVCLGLIGAGAIGNLLDRLILHYVIDFLRFDFGSRTFPIFNFADCFAVIGTVLFVIYIIFSGKEFDEFWTILFKKKKKES